MHWRQKVVFDTESDAELPVPGIVELFPIVGDDDLGNTKPTDDRLPGKVLNISLGDFCQGFSFYPLGEVVDGHH